MSGSRTTRMRGMTLVETMVVLAVISLVLSVVAVSLTDIFGARLSQGTGQISAVCRYGYDLATLRGKMHRLAVDLSARTFWLEEVELPKDCGLVPDSMNPDASKSEDNSGVAPAAPGTGKAVTDMRVKKEELPTGINFEGILTNRSSELVKEGTEYVYFFPDGTAEKAFLWVSDGEEIWTVEVKPLQGTGWVHKENLSTEEFRRR